MKITFRCPPELKDKLPKPYPAKRGLPDWLKAMPMSAYSADLGRDINTVKHCPPFIDAMSQGFIIPLPVDLKVEKGVFEWDWGAVMGGEGTPPSELGPYPQAPIGYHVSAQATGTPFFKAEQAVIKFFNLWTIELPPGYSLLATHPVNRNDLPFQSLTGLIDCDRFSCTMVHFPALWLDPDFCGTLEKGTPVAQCVPVERQSYELGFEEITGEAAEQFKAFHQARQADPNLYKNRYRAKKA